MKRFFVTILLLASLSVFAAAPKADAPGKYDWDKVAVSKLDGELETGAKKCLEALKGKKVVVLPFCAQKVEAGAVVWGVEKVAETGFKERFKSADVTCVECPDFAKKFDEVNAARKVDSPLPFSPAAFAAAAKEGGAGAVVVCGFQLASQRSKVTLSAFDATGEKKLFNQEFFVAATDLTAAALTPKLSRDMVAWVESEFGKKLGRGECSDLADKALAHVGAKTFGSYKWGKEVSSALTPLPGDIVQFENAKIGGSVTAHHTVMVYQILGPRHFTVLHQNWTGGTEEGRKVGNGSFDLRKWTAGEVHIFRPTKE